MDTRYPDCEVQLVGTHAHPISIYVKVKKVLEKHLREKGMAADEIQVELNALKKDLLPDGGDIDEVLQAAFRWVTAI
ncbi:hypothetical protein ABT282_07180 [Streptomyces sp. NPDC000927]|uniref:hypothetical protein n=1 Tax=Streptomyces sp. NPDC000927 TaxID=3154371 RepID=UPI00331FA02F